MEWVHLGWSRRSSARRSLRRLATARPAPNAGAPNWGQVSGPSPHSELVNEACTECPPAVRRCHRLTSGDYIKESRTRRSPNMNPRNFRKLRGWIDYDRIRLGRLTDEQKIAYLPRRLNIALLPPLDDLFASISAHPNYSPLLCYANCVCCAIEAFGKFLTGNFQPFGQAGPNFRAFVTEYMDARYQRKVAGRLYMNVLWEDFRNGIAHGFCVKLGGFEGDGTVYFKTRQIAGKKALIISPICLHNDFKQAVAHYLQDLQNAAPTDPIRIRYLQTFNAVFIQGV